MKKIIFIFLILLVAIGVGYLIHQDPGYLIVSYNSWLITTSIWIGAITLLLTFYILYLIIRLIKNIFGIPKRLARRRKFKSAQKYQLCLARGLEAMALGEFKSAEKYFLKSTQNSSSYTNYLLAAKAAHDERHFEKRDTYLHKALELNPDARFAIELSQARFYLQSDQLDEALGILKQLYRQKSNNPLVLSGLKTIYIKMHDIQSLYLILPQLKKQKLISADEISLLNLKI